MKELTSPNLKISFQKNVRKMFLFKSTQPIIWWKMQATSTSCHLHEETLKKIHQIRGVHKPIVVFSRINLVNLTKPPARVKFTLQTPIKTSIGHLRFWGYRSCTESFPCLSISWMILGVVTPHFGQQTWQVFSVLNFWHFRKKWPFPAGIVRMIYLRERWNLGDIGMQKLDWRI